MPKIEIKEKDLSVVTGGDVTTNMVYIPGYANIGPVNTPTLCETLEDFQFIFGAEPYTFREDQKWDLTTSGGTVPTNAIFSSNNQTMTASQLWGTNAYDETTMGYFYQAGDLEKSYMIASELLNLGIPVLYERVFTNNIDDWTSKLNVPNDSADQDAVLRIKSSDPGAASSKLEFAITNVVPHLSAQYTKLTDSDVQVFNFTEKYYYTKNEGSGVYVRYLEPTELAGSYTYGSGYYTKTSNTAIYTNVDTVLNDLGTPNQIPADNTKYYTVGGQQVTVSSMLSNVTDDNGSAPTWVADKYYVLESSVYTLTNSEPADWTTNYSDYYEINNDYKTFSTNTYYRIDNITVNNGYYKSISGFESISVSVKRNADNNLGIATVQPTTTVFTTISATANNSTTIKLLENGVETTDNTGLITITLNKSNQLVEANINQDGTINYQSLKLPDTTTVDSHDEFTVYSMYTYLADKNSGYKPLDALLDKGEYIIKFITSGAYPVFEFCNQIISQKMINVAGKRGDCTALIDHTPNPSRNLAATSSQSVYNSVSNWVSTDAIVNDFGEDCFVYGSMFTPWGTCNCSTLGINAVLPASFMYLAAYAVQVGYTNNWLATAGVSRGIPPKLRALQQNITNAIADSYQPRDGVSINAITNIKPYGLTIWGARTLKNNRMAGDLTATSFLNIRQLTNDVKRSVWVAAKSLTYEQNTDLLWLRFKGKLIPLLNQMVQGGGISSYELLRKQTTKKATVVAIVRLYPIEPVEDWDITIELSDNLATTIG